MRARFLFLLLIPLFAANAWAQGAPAATTTAPPAPKTYASADDIQAMIAKAKADHMGATIVASAPYRAGMEYRAAASSPVAHPNDDELIYIIEGSGTLTMGGTLVDPKLNRLGALAGTAITGGTDLALTPGTFILVPQGTPHAFSAIKDTVIDMALHLPHPAADAKPAP